MTATAESPEVRAGRFASEHRLRIEAALAASVGTLGDELKWVEQVTAQAVGIGGATGGRRWRPLLVLAGAEAMGRPIEAVMDVAVAVELTHTASLVLDDLPCMDDSAQRRGHLATHRVVGTAGAILVSVGLLGIATELLGRHPNAGGANAARWGRAIGLAGMSGGQAVDVVRSGALRGSARRLHRQKTTALSELALECAARAVGMGSDTAAALGAYGRDLGWAYQLADDLQDAAEDQALGYGTPTRDPAAHCRRLLRRAERRLRDSAALRQDGVDLLVAFGRTVVPSAAPGPFAWGR